jgi:hypothetical protein
MDFRCGLAVHRGSVAILRGQEEGALWGLNGGGAGWERGLARRGEGRVGRVVKGVVCLIGAGPAGWLRESGSRLPHSKVTVPVTEGGACGERGWQAHSVRGESCNSDSSPEPSAAGSRGLLTGLRYGTRGGKKEDLCGVWTSWKKRSQARCPCHFWGEGKKADQCGVWTSRQRR